MSSPSMARFAKPKNSAASLAGMLPTKSVKIVAMPKIRIVIRHLRNLKIVTASRLDMADFGAPLASTDSAQKHARA
jgi:hypothetical protein